METQDLAGACGGHEPPIGHLTHLTTRLPGRQQLQDLSGATSWGVGVSEYVAGGPSA